jgi:hypothetical protein
VKKENDISRPDGWPITYLVPPVAPSNTAGSAGGAGSGTKAVTDEALLDDLNIKVEKLKIETLNKFSKDMKDNLWNQVYETMLKEMKGDGDSSPSSPSSSLSLKQARMHHLDRDSTRLTNLENIIIACDDLLKEIDMAALSSRLGLRSSNNDNDDDDDDAVAVQKLKKKTEEEKAYVIDALTRKCRAYLDLEPTYTQEDSANNTGGAVEQLTSKPTSSSSPFLDSFKLLQQWEDITATKQVSKYGRLVIGYYSKNKKWGSLLKYANTCLDDKIENDVKLEKQLRELRVSLMKEFGWDFVESYEASWKLITNPASYTLF